MKIYLLTVDGLNNSAHNVFLLHTCLQNLCLVTFYVNHYLLLAMTLSAMCQKLVESYFQAIMLLLLLSA